MSRDAWFHVLTTLIDALPDPPPVSRLYRTGCPLRYHPTYWADVCAYLDGTGDGSNLPLEWCFYFSRFYRRWPLPLQTNSRGLLLIWTRRDVLTNRSAADLVYLGLTREQRIMVHVIVKRYLVRQFGMLVSTLLAAGKDAYTTIYETPYIWVRFARKVPGLWLPQSKMGEATSIRSSIAAHLTHVPGCRSVRAKRLRPYFADDADDLRERALKRPR